MWMNPQVESFYDSATSTFTHVVYDHDGGRAAIVDPVLDYDPAQARTSTVSADRVLAFVDEHALSVDCILETHAHADHLTAAAYLKRKTGARVAIGHGITRVQERFKALFGLEPEFATDGRQFDQLLADGETFAIGQLQARAIATPGHTDDSLTYLIGDAAFVGDTVFAPETGTARLDFPGGDARKLYRSIQTLLDFPPDTRLFLCHDYPSAGRQAHPQSSLQEQAQRNVHVGGGTDEAAFVKMRTERDATLAAPKLILPSLQVNIRAGELPAPSANGIQYLRLPMNQLGAGAP
ncbi:MBL fold metallo-hydrolase [Xanthomonas vesicatoria]|uniref:MBL fold metallo-hydrolase n=2 Tax=Xanthomonas vesicatoria TaxID=56460 RepID=UPI0009BDD295|nr:MBL fold metallo-hydrolase [Xanthomonas vesicatoria]MCC8557856.1 MBL fold metallo-hydrolase [Xanthomonas vesicatoria]MCC8601574.1 MBL fold metallo-hydrolase [Xanthomonas vesicatoria]MCC8609243.1 MBL fold metallo-hydrolase [Xanthomonas vesicatoria]MCC8672707.1 MBL fold metallo-hydrolase [Xanthomonas vesicatoria]MCC8678548.1 MBL fold metallo-hydrolase [Xanthomonas vesicatoria]